MTQTTTRSDIGSGRSVRRWWRALDQLTLNTMNPPIPAHVRAAMRDLTGTVRPDAAAPDDANRALVPVPARHHFRGEAMSKNNTTTFAATVRAAAPGHDEHTAGPDTRSNAEFARAIRAAAPGRDHR